MAKTWTPDELLQLARAYQAACVLAAAADLDLFRAPAGGGSTAEEIARARSCDLRAVTILLDSLAALELLEKAAPTPSTRSGRTWRRRDSAGSGFSAGIRR